jgi:hypothetical protein
MKILKTLAALATFATIAGSAVASDCETAPGHGIYVRYGHKNKGCAILIDSKGRKAQNSPNYLCGHGADQVDYIKPGHAKVFPGRELRLCTYNPKGLKKKLCTGLIEVREAGDLNGDGEINVIDMMLLHGDIMGTGPDTWPMSTTDEDAADLNGDGEVNVIDLMLLLAKIQAD